MSQFKGKPGSGVSTAQYKKLLAEYRSVITSATTSVTLKAAQYMLKKNRHKFIYRDYLNLNRLIKNKLKKVVVDENDSSGAAL